MKRTLDVLVETSEIAVAVVVSLKEFTAYIYTNFAILTSMNPNSRQMPEVFSSPLEDDIRRRANGGEKAVFAQRNPLTEMYPNAEYRNFEQEKTDECLEVSRQPSHPSAHILLCRAC